MNTAFILTGGNLGDRKKHLSDAVTAIGNEVGTIKNISGLYETAAWGKEGQPAFLNQVLEVETSLFPHELLEALLTIEKRLGRERTEKMGPRIVDLDILFYNDLVLSDAYLIIPHPHISKRRFVLTPLAEIAPGLVHPINGKTIAEMLTECADPLQVKMLEPAHNDVSQKKKYNC